MKLGEPSLDHLRVFLAVAEEGSFNRAAKRLGRAISVVSYAISTLENQLGLSLFAREGSRRPVLTDAGKALLADACTIAADADALLARARSLHQGLEAELPLAVDVMVPGKALARLLRDFRRTFPSVALRLHAEALGAVAALVLERRAVLGIAGPQVIDHPELDRREIGHTELVPVAAPSHPLARQQSIAPGEARSHLQLVLTDRSPLTQGSDFSVLAALDWRLADLGAKHALLKEGIGWGNMPRPMVAEDIARGDLVALDLPEGRSHDYRFFAIWRRDTPPGPAADWALAAFEERLCPDAQTRLPAGPRGPT